MEPVPVKLATNVPGLGAEGDVVQLALQPADVHEAEEMTNYLAGFTNPGLRATEAAKVVPVDHKQSKYRTFNADNAFLRAPVKVADEAAPPELVPVSATAELALQDRCAGAFIPKQTEWEARWDVREVALERCSKALDLDLEVDIWTLLSTTGSWASASFYEALGPTTKWNGGTSSDPIKNIQDRMEASYQDVTDIWMNLKVCNAFLRHDKVKDYIKLHVGDGGAGRLMSELNRDTGARRDFELPGIGRVKVVTAKYTDTIGGVPGYCLGNHVVLTCSPPGVPTHGEAIATAYTHRRKGDSGSGYLIREVPLGARGAYGGTLLVVSVTDKPSMTGNTCGGLLTGAVA